MAINFLTRSRHGSVYYFRRRVPDDLLSYIGKPYLVKSLHTYEKRLAIILARNLASQTDQIFIKIRNMAKNPNHDELSADFTLEIELNDFGKPSRIKVEAEAHEKDAVDSAITAALGNNQPTIIQKISPYTQKPFSLAIQEYYEKAERLKPNTIANYRSKLRHASEFFGETSDLLSLEQLDIVNYADHVRKTINNNTTRGLYIQIVATFINWHRIRAGKRPFTTKTLIPGRDTPESEDRKAFTLEHMQTLFTNALQYRLTEPHKWWVTVAVAFIGCRIEELSQVNLKTDLIHDSKSNVWYFKFDESLDDDGDKKKSMKKPASWRHAPIHSALIRHGFLEFLQNQINNGATRPFELGWKPRIVEEEQIYKWSHYITKWGGRELVDLDKKGLLQKDTRTYFHSMRHTFAGLLGDAGVSSDIIEALSGRRVGGSDQERYGKIKTNHTRLSETGIEPGLIKLEEVLNKVIKI